ncbi:hypothetical protein GOV09_02470 [Candidatus Woesearchaeota archaeon]|nr:hypothetical protein [Candidatus Woesearchaeota archaeon]
MNKKGDGFKILNYGFWRMLFLVIIFFTLWLLVSTHVNNKIELYDLRAVIFSHRAIYGELSHESPLALRTYPGVIKEKLPEELIRADDAEDTFSARIILERDGQQKEIFYNQKWFERDEPLSKFSKFHDNLFWRYLVSHNGSEGKMQIKTVEYE